MMLNTSWSLIGEAFMKFDHMFYDFEKVVLVQNCKMHAGVVIFYVVFNNTGI